MLKTIHTIGAVAILTIVAACQPTIGPVATTAPPPGAVTPASVCGDIAAVSRAPDAAAQLARIDPHSALGVVWAHVQSGCVNGVPVAGVTASWTAEVWGMAKAMIPQFLPKLIPLLIGR